MHLRERSYATSFSRASPKHEANSEALAAKVLSTNKHETPGDLCSKLFWRFPVRLGEGDCGAGSETLEWISSILWPRLSPCARFGTRANTAVDDR